MQKYEVKMNKIIFTILAITIGLSANADYTVQTYQPIQGVDYTNNQLYGQTYGQNYVQPYSQTYGQNYNQPYYQNPYQAQYNTQCVNPYQNRNPYTYGNGLQSTLVNSALSGIGSTGGTTGIAKNLGRSMLYSMIRGY